MRINNNKWIGLWVESEGYWLKIDVVNDEFVFERSGDFKSRLTFLSLAENGNTLSYEEKDSDSHYIHTLRYISDTEIVDEWFDKTLNRVWQTTSLVNKDRVQETLAFDIKDEGSDAPQDFVYNKAAFDQYQHKLVELIATEVLERVRGHINDDVQAAQLTDDITFSVSSILDGSSIMELDGKQVVPCIGFYLDEDRKKILSNRDGSWMHEYAIGFADSVIERE